MRRFIAPLAAAAAYALSAASAYALPTIASGSEINVTGSATFNVPPPGGTGNITFTNPADMPVGATTLSFTALGTQCTGCVQMSSPFQYEPFLASLLYTVTNNGATATFTAKANTLTTIVGPTDLILHDTGTFTLTGFAATKGTMNLTVNQGQVTGSFSSTGASSGGGGGSVPEPASLMLLGVGLVGLGLVRRRSR